MRTRKELRSAESEWRTSSHKDPKSDAPKRTLKRTRVKPFWKRVFG